MFGVRILLSILLNLIRRYGFFCVFDSKILDFGEWIQIDNCTPALIKNSSNCESDVKPRKPEAWGKFLQKSSIPGLEFNHGIWSLELVCTSGVARSLSLREVRFLVLHSHM